MYLAEQRVFAFRLRRVGGEDRLEGISRRYTAISLIGLKAETPQVQEEALHGHAMHDVCTRLIEAAQRTDDIGEAALTTWAARLLEHPEAGRAVERLRVMSPVSCSCPTVELSWCLSALAISSSATGDPALADAIAHRLLATQVMASDLFAHWPDGASPSALRSHVACYADLVYPIQALSLYFRATGSQDALTAARRCAERMCRLQGPQGQWWWHYDVRTGRVVEGYPVYAVHQDAMGPMALHALRDACGENATEAITASLKWLMHAPELDGSLVDRQADVIWRKVARREPGKLTRRIQAAASRVHSALRVPGLDTLFPPVEIDFETRPYHMGWLLHAFPADTAG